MYTVNLIVLGMLVAIANGCSVGKQMIKSGGITQQERQAIVDSHNSLRQSVALGQVSSQPPAANMMEMKWDDELASRAQHWADNCVTAHDRATQRDVGRFPVGQNIAATWTTRRPSTAFDSTPDFDKQINAWFDEVRAYGFKPTGYSHGTGHYSQLVWGESSHVGCGFSFYYDPSRGYTKIYVCNYGPGGNVIGFNPYEKGLPACSSFGLSDSQKYSGLCADTYGNTLNEVSYDHAPINVIPESAPDAIDTSSYNAFNYKAYSNEFESTSTNNNNNNNNNNYQWPSSSQEQQSYQKQNEPNKLILVNPYSGPSGYESYTTPKPVTFKPFVSIFGDTSDTISKTAQKFFTNALAGTKRGFRFGTLYL